MAGFPVDAVNGFLQFERKFSALINAQASIAGIGEPDVAVWMDDDVIRPVEPFPVELVGQNGDFAGLLVANKTPGLVLASELAALPVERIAIAEIGWFAKYVHMAVFFEPAHLAVVRNVAPDQIV